jgi:hypothetical protein
MLYLVICRMVLGLSNNLKLYQISSVYLILISVPYLGRSVNVKPKSNHLHTNSPRYRLPTSRFQKTDMVRVAVTITVLRLPVFL